MHIGFRYLGFGFGDRQDQAVSDKVAVMSNTHLPQTKNEVQRSLGIASYYCRFIPRFGSMATPLIDLLKGRKGPKSPLKWEAPALSTFQAAKDTLCVYPLIHMPLPEALRTHLM